MTYETDTQTIPVHDLLATLQQIALDLLYSDRTVEERLRSLQSCRVRIARLAVSTVATHIDTGALESTYGTALLDAFLPRLMTAEYAAQRAVTAPLDFDTWDVLIQTILIAGGFFQALSYVTA